MPPVLVLLSLLVGTLEVTAAPYEKGVRPDEMVTRCIVEVLSNALAKPNAPPIDPECKEILNKSTRHSLDDKDAMKQYEATNIRLDPVHEDKHHPNNEETKQSTDMPKGRDEEKRHHVENENSEEEADEKETKHNDEKEEGTGHSKERHFVVDDDEDDDKREYKDHHEKEEIEKKDHHDDAQEDRHDIFGKQPHPASKSVEEFSEEEDEEPRNLGEMLRRHPVTKSWKEQLFHPDKYHVTHSNEGYEESDEKEEKRSYKPKNELVPRILDYGEKRNHHEELRNHIGSNEETYPRIQKPHFDEDILEKSLKKNEYDKRSHHEKESSEESREKRHHHRDREEDGEQHDSSDENNENELKGHQYEEKRYYEEAKRWPGQQNSRLNYEQNQEDSEESEEDIEKRQEDSRLEKEKMFGKLRHYIHDSEEDNPYKQGKKAEEKRHYIGEEMVDEMKRYYPNFSREKDLRHYNEENANNLFGQNTEESNEKYKRHHSEEETRSFNKYGLSDNPLRWKNRYFESHDNSEEERKRSLEAKNIFPDYGDYDLWSKRQFFEDMNHESPPKFHKFEDKRQNDRMDELAQLLNYKKKSVEFPDFYDSEEIKKRHYNERGRLRQHPLTEEEEKELENLAIMDLELQKIAEKLSNNRQG